jgi:hypothetical protein
VKDTITIPGITYRTKNNATKLTPGGAKRAAAIPQSVTAVRKGFIVTD